MDKKTKYTAWGLDEPTPTTIEASLVERERIFKRITRRLDRMAFLLLLSTAIQVALIYAIYIKL